MFVLYITFNLWSRELTIWKTKLKRRAPTNNRDRSTQNLINFRGVLSGEKIMFPNNIEWERHNIKWKRRGVVGWGGGEAVSN